MLTSYLYCYGLSSSASFMEKGTLYPHPVKTLFMFRGHTPCNQWKAAYTLSCAPDQLSGPDKSFNILTRHLLISKLGLLPPSSQRFCDYLRRMIVTITHKVASLLPLALYHTAPCYSIQLLPALTSLTLQFMGGRTAIPPTPGPLQVPFTSTWKALLPSQCH